MGTHIIDGRIISADIKAGLEKEIRAIKEKHGITPGLAVVLVGNDPASEVYVKMKVRSCEQIGLYSRKILMDDKAGQKELLEKIDELNQDPKIHGILVQHPMPSHIDENKIFSRIDPAKDVDGFNPISAGQLMIGIEGLKPCTPYGVLKMLEATGIDPAGQHVVVLGRSNIVGKPVAMMLLQKAAGADATVTICHSRTRNLAEITSRADILIAAIGRPEFVGPEMVKKGAVVIDVGTNRVDDPSSEKGYKLVGDVDFEAVSPKCKAISPSPGGVGPMTIAMLLHNTVTACKRIHGLE
ncbi:MAG: bifunctional methylenetetrahydrofolate dehydrogenase/methenyltetrahydrofolate cyclohydrolase FolD [Spirochaetales bacterium]|nr:bifunctional methylenetetrahydrofolate dehydrogenase/methenyltetrahydrofolate cyclohydrolase FolD [Spirochaetales bacterium]